MLQGVQRIGKAILLTIGGSLLVRKAATVAVVGLALGLVSTAGAQAQARQSYFGLHCDKGVVGQLAYHIQYEHRSMASSNYCLSGTEAHNPWVYANATDGKVLSISVSLMVDSADKTQHKTCTMTNGSQSLICTFPPDATHVLETGVIFQYEID